MTNLEYFSDVNPMGFLLIAWELYYALFGASLFSYISRETSKAQRERTQSRGGPPIMRASGSFVSLTGASAFFCPGVLLISLEVGVCKVGHRILRQMG